MLVAAVAMTACASNDANKEQTTVAEPAAESAVLIKSANAELQKISLTETYTSEIKPYKENDVTPAVAGLHISQIKVDVGDHVRAGQKLAEMDNAALTQTKAQYENAKATFERSDELYKFGGESKANWEAVKTQYEVAKSTYENMLENTSLISPISGVVTARNYDNGDMVTGQPIFVVQQINPVKIYINVSESLYSYIKKGMSVDVELDAIPEKKFEGKVSRITPLIDPQTRTFEVELTVANGKEEIKPGMYARATMSYGSRKNVVVPDRAVVKMMGSGDRFIYVLKADGTVSYQKVELGRRMNDKFEVLSGVADGDEVVVSGQSALKNGIAVERVK